MIANRAVWIRVCTFSGMLTAAAVAAACGGSSGPTAPAASVVATPTVSSVAVTSSASAMWLGQTLQMSATTTLSNGTTQSAPSGTWGSDAPGVATVSGTGLVTTVGPGDVTVYFDAAGGGRGTKRLSVYSDFEGTWSGNYQIANCSQTGGFQSANFCGTFAVGTVLPFRIVATVSGSGVVSATWLLGSLNFGPANGTAGSFYSTVTLTSTRFDSSLPSTSVWTLTQTSPNRISGSQQITFTSTSYSGTGVASGPIISYTKASLASASNASAVTRGPLASLTDAAARMGLRRP